MKDIVQIAQDGEPRASTEAIAAGYELQHKNVLSLLKRHQHSLQAFGPLAFETRVAERAQGGGAPTEYALLNERQTMLLLTLMRNTAKVVAFKVQLIQEFCRMNAALQNRDLGMWERRLRFEAKDEASRALGSHGSRLMHTRRKEIPPLKIERAAIVNDMERPLFAH